MDYEFNEYDDYYPDYEIQQKEPTNEDVSCQLSDQVSQNVAPPIFKKRVSSYRRKSIIDVKDFNDSSIENLIKTQLQGNLASFLSEPQKVIQKLSQIYMRIMTMINEPLTEQCKAIQYIKVRSDEYQTEQLFELFFQGLHFAQHTDLIVQTNDYVIALPLDRVGLLSILKYVITQSSCGQRIREYFIRLLTFYCLPQKYFIFDISHGDCQQIILSKLSQHFTDNNEQFDPLALELTASVFLCNINAVTEQVKSIIWIMNIYLESILDSEHQTHSTNVQILIIIKLFAVFTLNKSIQQHLHLKNLHIMLYNAIKFSTPIFSNNIQGVQYEDILRKMMVILIGRIAAVNDQDDRFAQILYSDLSTIIDSQTFNYAYDIINPLLNVKSEDKAFVCVHTKSKFSDFKQIMEMMEKNLDQKSTNSEEFAYMRQIQLDTSILPLKLKLELLKTFCESQNQQRKIPNKDINKTHQLASDQSSFGQTFKNKPNKRLALNTRRIPQGIWVSLLKFTTKNPIFGSQHFFEVINQKQGLLFIFEIMQDLKRIQICVYSQKAIQQGKTCKDSKKSFYCFGYQDNFTTLTGNNKEDEILFEMISNEIRFKILSQQFFVIDFQNLQSCLFKTPQSFKSGLNHEKVTLISAEIFQFSENERYSQFSDHQHLLLNQISNYEQLLQQALYYTRLVPVRTIRSSVEIEELQKNCKKKFGKCLSFGESTEAQVDRIQTFDQLKQTDIIVDLYIQLDNECKIFELPELEKDKYIERPLRERFIKIQGYERLALKIRQLLFRSDKIIKEYFIDFAEWLSVSGFSYQIAADEDLLHRFFTIYQDVHSSFHEGTYMLLKSLKNYLQKSNVSIRMQVMNSQLLDSLLLRAITYLSKLIHDNLESSHPNQGAPNHELKDIFNGAQPIKGKPKGIGYGDSNYNAKQFLTQQPAQKEQIKNLEGKALRSESGSQYQIQIIGEIFDIIYQVISSILIWEDESHHIMNSNIVVVIRSILYLNSISEMLQNQDTFLPIIKLLGVLAENDLLLQLFVQENQEGLTLYRILQGLQLQTKLILDSQFKQEQKNEKIRFINTIKGVAQYVERRLVENKYIEIRFIKKEEQKVNLEDKLKIHQFYNVLMKPLAVRDVMLLHKDSQWVAKMGAYMAKNSDSPTKMNRIISEISDLAEHLPIEATNSIFLRYDQNKMDCMRFIIFGASGTPYAHGAFQYEMFFDQDYPNRPPKVLLSTTGNGKFRFNPNLYACGKVCLSLLGTWGDNWISNVSTILQILISIMSMVMSEYVMFNEPGWENLMGTQDGEQKNRGYCNLVKLNNIRYAMIEQLRNPPLGFEEVIKKSFFLRKEIIIKEVEQWIREADLKANYQCSQNTSTYQQDPQNYKTDLIKVYEELKVELEKLATLDKTFESASQNGFVRETHIVNKKFSQIPQRERLNRIEQEFQLPQQEYMEVDTGYEAEIQQKAFDPHSQDVQNLMSRYIGVLGVDAVAKQSQASILLVGLDCLGVEVAKNIVLSGVKRLTLVDDKLCSKSDQCGQFYIWDHDINTPRSLATIGKLKHLNPYVMVDYIGENQIAQLINNYTMIVVCNQDNYQQLIELSNSSKIAIILATTHSVYGSIINYFGESFISNDPSGESIVPLNIENIDELGLVTLIKGQKHNLQEGDNVQIQEVKEIDNQNQSWNQVYKIKNVRLHDFQLMDLDPKMIYQSGGLVIQQKTKQEFNFERINQIISKPIYSEWMEPVCNQQQIVKRDFIHFLLSQRLNVWNPWDLKSLQNNMNKTIRDFDLDKKFDLTSYSEVILPTLALFILTSGGRLPPLEAYLGGLVSQEVLKFITQKYSPIQQVYLKNCEDVLSYDNMIDFVYLDEENNVQVDINEAQKFYDKFQFMNFEGSSEIVQPIQILFGKHFREKIEQSKLFLVGAGAIGCELLKNFAMCSFSTKGFIYVTDPDIIENSNLNRQFLFRSKHLRKPKSVTAAQVVKQMNPDIKVIPRLDKIGPSTEDTYNHHFYSTIDVVANALDNVQARLYVDGQCIENDIPLVESGTLGPKGHVQVIIPHETESYGSKQDPEESNDIPYCTLKMFPESELHCMEWARDKFESYFLRKPQAVCQVLQALKSKDPVQALKSLQQQQLEIALRQIQKVPYSFEDCIRKGRQKFEKLFSTSIKRLLEAYPLDSKVADGKLFWTAPKRAPSPINFEGLQIGQEFVRDFAILHAINYNIPYRVEDVSNLIKKTCEEVLIPEYHSTEEQLQSIKNQLKPVEQQQTQDRQLDDVIQDILQVCNNIKYLQQSPQPIEFEKDNDENHHVSFITAATNSRSMNYSLKQVDWLWCKLKAGRIVPAMATTTSCISALQTIEILKIIQKKNHINKYQNTFLNVAIPIVMVSEPAQNEKIMLPNGIEYSFWTKHIFVLQHKQQKLYELIYFVEKDLGVRIQQLSQGERAILVLKMLPPLLQDQEKLYDTPILDLIVVRPHDTHIDLNSVIEINKEIQGPKIRILFK